MALMISRNDHSLILAPACHTAVTILMSALSNLVLLVIATGMTKPA